MELTLILLSAGMLVVTLIAIAVAIGALRQVQERLGCMADLYAKLGGRETKQEPPQHLPKVHVAPCEDPGMEGWVQVDIGTHPDAVRVVLRTEDGKQSKYGAVVLRMLMANSDPQRGE